MTLIYIATRMRKELQLSKLWPMLIDTRTHTLTYIDTISLPISSNPDFCTKNFLPPSYVTIKEYCLQTGVGFGFVQHLSSSFFLSCLRFWWKPRHSPDGLPCSSNAYQAGRQARQGKAATINIVVTQWDKIQIVIFLDHFVCNHWTVQTSTCPPPFIESCSVHHTFQIHNPQQTMKSTEELSCVGHNGCACPMWYNK